MSVVSFVLFVIGIGYAIGGVLLLANHNFAGMAVLFAAWPFAVLGGIALRG